jgi:hypothetical protein
MPIPESPTQQAQESNSSAIKSPGGKQTTNVTEQEGSLLSPEQFDQMSELMNRKGGTPNRLKEPEVGDDTPPPEETTESKKEESQETQTPETPPKEEKKEEASTENESKKEESTEQEEEGSTASLMKDLMEQVNALSLENQNLQAQLDGKENATPEESKTETSPTEKKDEFTLDVSGILSGDVDVAEQLSDNETAVPFLTKFAQEVASQVIAATGAGPSVDVTELKKELLLDVGKTSGRVSQDQIEGEVARTIFTALNPHLMPFMGFVARRANQLRGEHKDWSIFQVFTQAGQDVDKYLKMTQGKSTQAPPPSTKGGGSRPKHSQETQGNSKNPLAGQMQELKNHLNP